jgi:CDGSH-type Zn-finger protein
MSDKKRPRIQCVKNGPYLVHDLEVLKRTDGTRYEVRETTKLCRCGGSKNKPYCDGTHKRIGFSDEKAPDRTPDKRETYVGGTVTIHDNRGICAHAGFCSDGLASVFRMKTEPWIDPDGAEVEKVVETIRKCPSGALSYSIDGVEHRDQEREPSVLVIPGGPYSVVGGADLEGVEVGDGASQEHFDLCRCGGSKNKPFCNGAHWNTKFDEDAPDRAE